jgi:hypothetical protein
VRQGIGSYASVWRIGVAGYPLLPRPMTAKGLLVRAEELGVRVVQFAGNFPLDSLTQADRATLRRFAERTQIDVKVGTRGIDPANVNSHLRSAQFFVKIIATSQRISLQLIQPAIRKANAAPPIVNRKAHLRRFASGPQAKAAGIAPA